MMSRMSSRESTSPVIPTTHDRNTRQTFQQDRNGLSYGFHGIQQGKQAILTIIDLLTGWPEVIPIPNKSANTITKAFIRHYLPRHVPQVHTIRQWHRIQEPDFRQSDKGSGH